MRLIPFEVETELLFWQNNLKHTNGAQIRLSPRVNKIVYSDASDKSYGGYIVKDLVKQLPEGTSTKEKFQPAQRIASC